MAKETTDKFEVEVAFSNSREKFEHFRSRGSNILYDLQHIGSRAHSDKYEIIVKFKDDKEKWYNYFHKGEWVKSYTVKNVVSTDLGDKFEVEVVYKGQQKAFEKSFHAQNWTFEVTSKLLDSQTKNLGVVNPYGKKTTKSEEEVLGILKTYLVETLKNGGFTKKGTIAKVKDKNDFGVSIITGVEYFGEWSKKFVCIHLPKCKVGFAPVQDAQDKFVVYVSHPGSTSSWRSKVSWTNSSEDHGLPGRVVKTKLPGYRSYHSYEWKYKEYFLGDPNLDRTIIDFFKVIKEE
jgi:hypothetical protein